VAVALHLRPVDHADRAFEVRARQRGAQLGRDLQAQVRQHAGGATPVIIPDGPHMRARA